VTVMTHAFKFLGWVYISCLLHRFRFPQRLLVTSSLNHVHIHQTPLQSKMLSILLASFPILSLLTALPTLTFAQSVTGCPPSYMGIGVHAGTHGTGFALLTNYTNCPPTPNVAPVIFLTDTHSLPTADPTGFCSMLDGVSHGGGGDEGVYGGGSIVDCITGDE
jgi:hypothetical protein